MYIAVASREASQGLRCDSIGACSTSWLCLGAGQPGWSSLCLHPSLTHLPLIDIILPNISSKSSTFSEFRLLPRAPFKAPQASPSTFPTTRGLSWVCCMSTWWGGSISRARLWFEVHFYNVMAVVVTVASSEHSTYFPKCILHLQLRKSKYCFLRLHFQERGTPLHSERLAVRAAEDKEVWSLHGKQLY